MKDASIDLKLFLIPHSQAPAWEYIPAYKLLHRSRGSQKNVGRNDDQNPNVEQEGAWTRSYFHGIRSWQGTPLWQRPQPVISTPYSPL